MPLAPADQYRTLYPGLPLRILRYFDFSNTIRSKSESGGNVVRPRTVFEFVQTFAPEPLPDPQIVNEICQRLMKYGWISPHGAPGGLQGMDQRYLSRIRDPNSDERYLSQLLDCAVYGFPCIYDTYRSAVLPIIHFSDGDDRSVGTAFVIGPHAVATAAHCVDGARKLALRGVAARQSAGASIFASVNPATDLAVIVFQSPVFADIPAIRFARGNVLSEVMVLGYPNVPGFVTAVAAEKALISSRLTPVRGSVASAPFEIFAQADLFLITARVRGGFSGGPVLDELGQCVGVVSREPTSQFHDSLEAAVQAYDNLGYGTVIPAENLTKMFDEIRTNSLATTKIINSQSIAFEDFPGE